MLILATVTLPPNSLASSSSAGAIIRQGPHHSAQKSTTTGSLDPMTSEAQLASGTLAVAMAEMISSKNKGGGGAAGVQLGRNAVAPRQAAPALSVEPAAIGRRARRADQHDYPIGVGKPEREHFRHERADLARRKIHYRSDLTAPPLIQRVVLGDLRGGFFR